MATEITYEVKTHEESFTEPEIFLRRKLEAHLPEYLRNYTTSGDLENLKNYRATSETFHPENHFYIFDNEGELLGFTHLWPQYQDDNIGETATISLPFVRDGIKEVEELLYRTTVEKAKSLGVKELRIIVDSTYEEEIKRLDEYGFNYSNLVQLHSIVSIDKMKFQPTEELEVLDFDLTQHGEDVLLAYEELGFAREQISNQFNMISDMGERLISWKVAYKNGKLYGHGVAFLPTEGADRASLNVVTRGIGLDDQTYQEVIHAIYGAHLPLLTKAKIKEVELFILETVLDIRPMYEEIGFEFKQRDAYTLNIE